MDGNKLLATRGRGDSAALDSYEGSAPPPGSSAPGSAGRRASSPADAFRLAAELADATPARDDRPRRTSNHTSLNLLPEPTSEYARCCGVLVLLICLLAMGGAAAGLLWLSDWRPWRP